MVSTPTRKPPAQKRKRRGAPFVEESPQWLAVRPDYIMHLRTAGRSKETIRTYESFISLFARWCDGEGIDLVQAGARDLRRYLAEQLERHSIVTSYNRTLALRSFYRVCVAEKLRRGNPAKEIKVARPKHEPKQPFTDDELRALIRAADNPRDRALLLILIGGGVRRAELLGMKRSDIDWERGCILIRHGKGDRQRWVAPGTAAMEALRDNLAGLAGMINVGEIDWERRRILLRRDDGADVWIEPKDRTMTGLRAALEREALHPHDGGEDVWIGRSGTLRDTGLYEIVSAIGRRAGVPDVHPHRFRVSFANRWLDEGGDLVALQGQMGHAQIEMTAHYSRYNSAKRGLEIQATMLDSLVEKAEPSPGSSTSVEITEVAGGSPMGEISEASQDCTKVQIPERDARRLADRVAARGWAVIEGGRRP